MVIIIRNGLGRGLRMCLSGFFIGAAVMGRPNPVLFPALLLLYFIFGRKEMKMFGQRGNTEKETQYKS